MKIFRNLYIPLVAVALMLSVNSHAHAGFGFITDAATVG